MLTLLVFDESTYEQKVQGLQAIAFSVVTVNDEHTKPTICLKESVGVRFKEGICAESCLTLWFESD